MIADTCRVENPFSAMLRKDKPERPFSGSPVEEVTNPKSIDFFW
jgi:hypothetical protein